MSIDVDKFIKEVCKDSNSILLDRAGSYQGYSLIMADVMAVLYDHRPEALSANTADEFHRLYNIQMIVAKLCRYLAAHPYKSEDSLLDLANYALLLVALERGMEKGHLLDGDVKEIEEEEETLWEDKEEKGQVFFIDKAGKVQIQKDKLTEEDNKENVQVQKDAEPQRLFVVATDEHDERSLHRPYLLADRGEIIFVRQKTDDDGVPDYIECGEIIGNGKGVRLSLNDADGQFICPVEPYYKTQEGKNVEAQDWKEYSRRFRKTPFDTGVTLKIGKGVYCELEEVDDTTLADYVEVNETAGGMLVTGKNPFYVVAADEKKKRRWWNDALGDYAVIDDASDYKGKAILLKETDTNPDFIETDDVETDIRILGLGGEYVCHVAKAKDIIDEGKKPVPRRFLVTKENTGIQHINTSKRIFFKLKEVNDADSPADFIEVPEDYQGQAFTITGQVSDGFPISVKEIAQEENILEKSMEFIHGEKPMDGEAPKELNEGYIETILGPLPIGSETINCPPTPGPKAENRKGFIFREDRKGEYKIPGYSVIKRYRHMSQEIADQLGDFVETFDSNEYCVENAKGEVVAYARKPKH